MNRAAHAQSSDGIVDRNDREKAKLNARELLADIRAGKSDAELMQAYNLSAKGLRRVFDKLVAAGIVTTEELDDRMPAFDGTVNLGTPFDTLDQGVVPPSESRLWRVPEDSPVEVPEDDLVRDIRTGMTDHELMEKHRLSSAELKARLDALVEREALTRSEVQDRNPGFLGTVALSADFSSLSGEVQPPTESGLWRTDPAETSIGGSMVDRNAAVADIRSGMSDAELMEKYRLSSRGLRSLFDKLIAAGTIRRDEVDGRMKGFQGTVALDKDFVPDPVLPQAEFSRDATTVSEPADGRESLKRKLAEVITDIRSGMDDTELMTKYKLSAAGVQSLFDKLIERGLLDRSEFDSRMPGFENTVVLGSNIEVVPADQSETDVAESTEIEIPRRIADSSRSLSTEEFLEDFRAGKSEGELMVAHRLSAAGLQSALDKLTAAGLIEPEELKKGRGPGKRAKISAAEVLHDIRLGLDDAGLMEKYRLSSKGLESLFLKLVQAGAIDREELDARHEWVDATMDVRDLMVPIAEGGTGVDTRPDTRERVGLNFEDDAAGVSEEVRPFSEESRDAPEFGESRFIVESHWYEERYAVVLLLIFCLPAGLYLLYRNKEFSSTAKGMIVGGIALALAFGFVLMPRTSAQAEEELGKLNSYYGSVVRPSLEGWYTKTLRLDWTTRTTDEHAKQVFHYVVAARKNLMSGGIQYVSFPKDSETYEVMDLETGERWTKHDTATLYFR